MLEDADLLRRRLSNCSCCSWLNDFADGSVCGDVVSSIEFLLDDLPRDNSNCDEVPPPNCLFVGLVTTTELDLVGDELRDLGLELEAVTGMESSSTFLLPWSATRLRARLFESTPDPLFCMEDTGFVLFLNKIVN